MKSREAPLVAPLPLALDFGDNMITMLDEGRELQISIGYWSGREKVFLDKQCVSSKWSMGGCHHMFNNETSGSPVNYEVEIGLRWHWLGKYVVIRKNGSIIFTDK